MGTFVLLVGGITSGAGGADDLEVSEDLVVRRARAVGGARESCPRHVVAGWQRVHGARIDVVATTEEGLKGLVHILLVAVVEGWIPRVAVGKDLWSVGCMRTRLRQVLHVSREHTQRATRSVDRRLHGAMEVFVEPATDVRDLRKGEEQGIPVASIAEVQQASSSRVGRESRGGGVAELARCIHVGEESPGSKVGVDGGGSSRRW